MGNRNLHVVHLLVRRQIRDQVAFLVYPHDKWVDANGQPYLTLPTKRSVADPLAPFLQGTSLEEFVDAVAQRDFDLRDSEYVLEQELESCELPLPSPSHHVATNYTIYPVDIWVAPAKLDSLASRVNGQWLTCDEAIVHPQISPTAQKAKRGQVSLMGFCLINSFLGRPLGRIVDSRFILRASDSAHSSLP